ncbi:IS3 family transposase [Streptomyces sp. KMM 9044]|uniref:IS3 family transposase n=1 Tax=Streptomyces sp. KMM 9044 TaxID=2744474 RepID=UPI002150786D|nr:IS3 family transposase [Streptomyces sp. KMM 9044]WAX76411.1 IS3 family transposase [Streptomyces sp. KMM 9044]
MVMKVYSPEFKADAVALYLSDPSHTCEGIGKDLGVSRETLRNRVRSHRTRAATGHGPNTGTTSTRDGSTVAKTATREDLETEPTALREQLKDARKENQKLAQERAILRKATKFFRRRDELVNRFQFIEDHHKTFPVKRLCEVLDVARSSFHKWRAAQPARAERERADASPAELIAGIHTESGGTYGSPRITAELREVHGMEIDEKKVTRVMRAFGIAGYRKRRRHVTTIPDPSMQPVPDLFRRDFTADAPNIKHMDDITCLPVGDGEFLYPATAIDGFSRRVAGSSIADHMRTEPVADPLTGGAALRGGLKDAVFHSDHGAQYASTEFAAPCGELGVTQSMGAVGTSADNAACESFPATLKREVLQDRRRWQGTEQCRGEVFRRLVRYNSLRRHSTNGQISPVAYEHSQSMDLAA